MPLTPYQDGVFRWKWSGSRFHERSGSILCEQKQQAQMKIRKRT
jgi:hypothetical protein